MYERIYAAWDREQKEERLQRLENDFYIAAKKFLEVLLRDKNQNESASLLRALLEKAHYNTSFLLSDLMNIRLDKILSSIRNGKEINKEKLTSEEKVLYEQLKNDLMRFFGKPALPSEVKELEEKKNSFILVRFVKPLPAIVGSDMKIYGPFQVEDIATIPKENAKALVLRNAAKPVSLPSL